MIEIPNLFDGVRGLYTNKGRPTPCHSNRASQLGYAVPELLGCVRRGVYSRTAWQNAEPWDVDALLRFEEGRRQERHVLADLAAAGYELIEQQMAFQWDNYQITGHLDAVLLVDRQGVPLEIKSAAPQIFSQITDFDSLNKKPWLRAYKCQITLYMLMKNIDLGVLLFKDKSAGSMKQINCGLDYELGEACIRTAEAINEHIANGTLPDRIDDRQTCGKCPFRLICLPDIDFGIPLRIVDDPLYEERLNRYAELQDFATEAKQLYEVIRDEAKSQADGGELNVIIGSWRLTGKPDSRGAFRMKIDRL